jgi:hypothetical protein
VVGRHNALGTATTSQLGRMAERPA